MIALCPCQVWLSWLHAPLRIVCQSCPTPKIARRKCAKLSITHSISHDTQSAIKVQGQEVKDQGHSVTVVSPGFVPRRGKDGFYVIGHLWWTSGPGAVAGRWYNSFVTNAVLIERAVSCWHLHQLISQTAHYLDNWLSDLLQSELKMNLLEVEGACVPAPHSWRRHCSAT